MDLPLDAIAGGSSGGLIGVLDRENTGFNLVFGEIPSRFAGGQAGQSERHGEQVEEFPVIPLQVCGFRHGRVLLRGLAEQPASFGAALHMLTDDVRRRKRWLFRFHLGGRWLPVDSDGFRGRRRRGRRLFRPGFFRRW